jgi:hypothetical protein
LCLTNASEVTLTLNQWRSVFRKGLPVVYMNLEPSIETSFLSTRKGHAKKVTPLETEKSVTGVEYDEVFQSDWITP